MISSKERIAIDLTRNQLNNLNQEQTKNVFFFHVVNEVSESDAWFFVIDIIKMFDWNRCIQ